MRWNESHLRTVFFSACESVTTSEGCVSCQNTYANWANNVHTWMKALQTSPEDEPQFGCLCKFRYFASVVSSKLFI